MSLKLWVHKTLCGSDVREEGREGEREREGVGEEWEGKGKKGKWGE